MTAATDVSSLAQALVEANDQLVGLYDLADVTSQSLDEEQLLHDILHRAARIVHAGSLVLTMPDRVLRVDADRDDHVPTDGATSYTTSLEASHSSGLNGQLRAHRFGQDFSTGDRKLLSAVLRTTLTAVETARLHQRALTSALDEQERRRAAETAQLALPKHRPTLEGVDLFFRTDQARRTGGDLFSYRVVGDDLMFAVGDVAGKGLSAAVMMTTAVCATRAAFGDSRAQTPGDQLALVSDWMFEHLEEAGVFISMFIGRYRPRQRTLDWANAGHSPCLVSTTHGSHHLAATAPPIGVLPLAEVSTNQTSLDDGDLVLIGSDGLTEQTDPSGQPFGESRLHDFIAQRLDRPAAETGSELIRAVSSFAGGSDQSDDRTVAVIRQEPVT